MATYTGTADANGDFSISLGSGYASGEKIRVTAEKDSATKSIELFAPSGFIGAGAIDIQGNLSNFPANIEEIVINPDISGVIGDYAFSASGLNAGHFLKKAKGLELPNGVTSVGRSSFEYWSSAETLTLPSTLASFGQEAFRGWTNAIGLVVPEGVESISGVNCFYGWTSAKTLELPSTIKSIGGGVFMNWSSLLDLTLPPSLESVSGGNELRGLSSLQYLRCKRLTPPTGLSSSTLSGLNPSCIIEVPAASLSTYQSRIWWSAYASQMVGV